MQNYWIIAYAFLVPGFIQWNYTDDLLLCIDIHLIFEYLSLHGVPYLLDLPLSLLPLQFVMF